MEKSKLNLVHTNRVELHNGVWHSIWEGTIVTPAREEKVRVYVMKIQNEEEPRLAPDVIGGAPTRGARTVDL